MTFYETPIWDALVDQYGDPRPPADGAYLAQPLWEPEQEATRPALPVLDEL